MWKQVGNHYRYMYNNQEVCMIMKSTDSATFKSWMCFVASLDEDKAWSNIFLDHSEDIDILKLKVLLKAKDYGWNIKNI